MTTPNLHKHKEPVIITAHVENIPVISNASYLQDARNRWYIHSVETKKLWDQHVDLYNKVKPTVVTIVDKVKTKVTNND